ncbi:hypothetical protein N431DRAFT_489010 [Stipitochalara longipes BDJ]|nr:hypothetical protein N431DRAFT_489010 [Stipitochalara longipes BDJ]
MSFRWVSGDIGPLICLAIKVINALDSDGGATRHYREATAFLQNIQKTLEPLQASPLLEAYPSSKDQIHQQVDKIKLAVDHFLKLAGKFEPDLGGTKLIGCHQHIFPKLKWRFVASRALTELMTELSGHMRILDTLLLRIVVETGSKLDNQTRTIEPRLNIAQETLKAQIQAIEQKGEQQQGAVLDNIRATFQSLSANLEERDELLTAFVEKLREDLYPLREDLEKQQTAAIKPLHDEISSGQYAANQNFHTVFMKLDDSAAAVDLVNKKVNTIGELHWGGFRKVSATVIPSPSPNSFLEQSLENSTYRLPDFEDEEGWLVFQERESETTGNVDPLDKHHEKTTALPHKSREALGGTALAENVELDSEALTLEEKQPVKDTPVAKSSEKLGGTNSKRKGRKKAIVQTPGCAKPAEDLLVAQKMELLEAIFTKITTLEERTRNRDNVAVKKSDFTKLEKATTAIVQAYQVMLPMKGSRSRLRHVEGNNRDWSMSKDPKNFQPSYAGPRFQSGRVYEISEASDDSEDQRERISDGSYQDTWSANQNAYYSPVTALSALDEYSTKRLAPYIPYELSLPAQIISFIFVIDELKVAQCCASHLQPRSRLANNYKDGLGFQTKSQHFSLKGERRPIYRWENGSINHAAGYTFSNENGLEKYREVTMFYNRGFVVAEGDASSREMRKETYPRDRWFDLLFRHDGNVSRVDLEGDKSYLARQASQQLVDSLGLGYHQNKNNRGWLTGLTTFLRVARVDGTIINGHLLNMMRFMIMIHGKLFETPMGDEMAEALSSQSTWTIKTVLAPHRLYCISSSGK